MSSKYSKKNIQIFERWSFAVPVLTYGTFLCMISILSLPLRPNVKMIIENDENINAKLEDSFIIKMKNSNFNSDKNNDGDKILSDKNEYLVSLNNNEVHRDETVILTDVFRK